MPGFPRNQAAPLLSTGILHRTRPQAIANGLLVIGETEGCVIFARYSPNRPHLVDFFTMRPHFEDSDILVVTQVHTLMRPLCFLQLTNGLPNQNLVAHVSSLVLWYLRYAGFRPGQNGLPVTMDHFPALVYILRNPEFLVWWHQDDNMARRVGDDLAADRRGTQRLELPAQGRELVRETQEVHGQRIGQVMNPHRHLAQQAQRVQLAQRAVERAQRVQQAIQQAEQVRGQNANFGQNTYHAQQHRTVRGPAVQNPVAPHANNAAGATQPGGERRSVANGQGMRVCPVVPPSDTANVVGGLHPGAGRSLHIDPRNDVNSLPNASRNATRVGHGNPIERRGNVNVQNPAVLGGRSNPIDLCGDDDVQNAPAAETPGVQAPPKCIFPLAFPLVKTKTAAELTAERAAAWTANKRATEDAFELLRKRLAKPAAEQVTESVVESVYESIAERESTSTSRPLPAVRPNPTSYRSKRASRVRKLKASGKSTIGFIYRINKGLQRTALKALKRKLAAQEQSEKNLDGLPKGGISVAGSDIRSQQSSRWKR